MLFLVDFGGQTAHLIARRVRDFGAETEIVIPEDAYDLAVKQRPEGIIFSGGPLSVYQDGAPTVDKRIFDLNIPILAICYGFQLVSLLLGGKVIGGKKEYGPARLTIKDRAYQITENIKDNESTVWMSHGDEITGLPKGFRVIGQTEHVPFAIAENEKKKITGLLFHPEVEHTEYGKEFLKNFLTICAIKKEKKLLNIDDIVEKIKSQVKDAYVIGAISGGVDSTVAGVLSAKAIGKQFIPIYVENGLMRDGNEAHVKRIFESYNIMSHVVHVEDEMLKKLQGIDDPEEKRKIIGNFYIEVFEREMDRLIKTGKNVKFLLQGTIYSDVIESQGTKHADKIKSHHNVGGLPEKMKLRLLEPVREFYKDEVRSIGMMLGLPDEFIRKQPFPGPGYAVRIRGEVTKERLAKAKQADKIILEELGKADILKNVFISFPVMTGASSTAVKGDGRFFGEVIAVRIVESRDVMTATWAEVPYKVLQRLSSRIVNEVPGVSRVVYDITTKPPATMEWE